MVLLLYMHTTCSRNLSIIISIIYILSARYILPTAFLGLWQYARKNIVIQHHICFFITKF